MKTKQGAASIAPDGGQALLIPQPKLRRAIGVSSVTLWRWRNDPKLGFPPATLINDRVYFSWSAVQAWLAQQQSA